MSDKAAATAPEKQATNTVDAVPDGGDKPADPEIKCSEEAWKDSCSAPQDEGSKRFHGSETKECGAYLELLKSEGGCATGKEAGEKEGGEKEGGEKKPGEKDLKGSAHIDLAIKQDLTTDEGRREAVRNLVDAEKEGSHSTQEWTDRFKKLTPEVSKVARDFVMTREQMEKGLSFDDAYKKTVEINSAASELNTDAQQLTQGKDSAGTLKKMADRIAEINPEDRGTVAKLLKDQDRNKWSYSHWGGQLHEMTYDPGMFSSDIKFQFGGSATDLGSYSPDTVRASYRSESVKGISQERAAEYAGSKDIFEKEVKPLVDSVVAANGKDEAAAQKLTETMLKVFSEGGRRQSEDVWSMARKHAGKNEKVLQDKHTDLMDLAGPERNVELAKQKRQESQANLKTAFEQDLLSPEGRKKAAEALVKVGQTEPYLLSKHYKTGWVDAEKRSGEQGKAASELSRDVTATQVLMNEKGLSFEQAYEKNEKLKESARAITKDAEEAISGKDRAGSMKKVADALAQLSKEDRLQLANHMASTDARWTTSLSYGRDEVYDMKFSNGMFSADLNISADITDKAEVRANIRNERVTGHSAERGEEIKAAEKVFNDRFKESFEALKNGNSLEARVKFTEELLKVFSENPRQADDVYRVASRRGLYVDDRYHKITDFAGNNHDVELGKVQYEKFNNLMTAAQERNIKNPTERAQALREFTDAYAISSGRYMEPSKDMLVKHAADAKNLVREAEVMAKIMKEKDLTYDRALETKQQLELLFQASQVPLSKVSVDRESQLNEAADTLAKAIKISPQGMATMARRFDTQLMETDPMHPIWKAYQMAVKNERFGVKTK